MDSNLNPRRRKKSTLGTHCKPGDPPPRPGFMFPIPQTRGLGRSRSVKKRPTTRTPQLNQASKEYIAKKRLFLRSPQSDLFGYSSKQDEVLTSSQRLHDKPTDLCPTHHTGSLLNLTGIQAITTPSPYKKITIPNLTVSQYHEKYEPPNLKSNTSSNVFSKSELPQSPGPSLYNQLILRELADIKPPVDPDDNIQLSSLSLEDKSRSSMKDSELKHNQITTSNTTVSTHSGVFSPLPPLIRSNSFMYNSDNKKNVSISSPTELNSNINMGNEYLNTTDTFILAEQTVIDHNMTLPAEQQNTTDSESDTEEELNQALEEIDQGIKNMNNVMNQMCSLKNKIQRLVDKHKRLKNNTDIDNKENMSVVKTKKTEHKWLSGLKTDNPSLLKMTPKPAKRSLSFLGNQSLTWTPHSLSNVLNEQMDELFE